MKRKVSTSNIEWHKINITTPKGINKRTERNRTKASTTPAGQTSMPIIPCPDLIVNRSLVSPKSRNSVTVIWLKIVVPVKDNMAGREICFFTQISGTVN